MSDLIGWRWVQAPDGVWHTYRKYWSSFNGFNTRAIKVPTITPWAPCGAGRPKGKRTQPKPDGDICPVCKVRYTRSIVEDE